MLSHQQTTIHLRFPTDRGLRVLVIIPSNVGVTLLLVKDLVGRDPGRLLAALEINVVRGDGNLLEAVHLKLLVVLVSNR